MNIHTPRIGVSVLSNVTLRSLISRNCGIFALIAMAVFLPNSAQAVTWNNNTGDSLWFTGSNWQGNAVPGFAIAADINSNSSAGSPVTLTNGLAGSIGSVTLGTSNGQSGFLRITTSGTLSPFNSSNIIVGNAGAGSIVQDAGNVTTATGGDVQLGLASTGSGSYSLSGGLLAPNGTDAHVEVGVSGTGLFIQTGGTYNMGSISAGTANLILGVNAGSRGTYNISGAGSTIASNTAGITVGQGGIGIFNQSDGNVGNSQQRVVIIGANAGSQGTYNLTGGVFNQASGTSLGLMIIGQSGTGTFAVSGSGSITSGGDILIGQNAGSVGTLNLSGTGGVARTPGATITVGGTGTGALNIAGNVISAGTIGNLIVRSGSAGAGTVNGYGTVSAGGDLTMNGMVIADGKGTGSKTLDFSALNGATDTGAIINTIENTTNNGWYAQSQGKLALAALTTAAGAGSVNWGESAGDTTIDLVNSARATFGSGHTAGNLTINLLATDRIELSNLPAGAIDVWNLTSTSSTLALTTLQVRYDDAAAGAGAAALSFYYSVNGSSWTLLSTTVDTTNDWATTTGSLATGYYALAVPEPSTVALVGAGIAAVLLRMRRNATRAQ